VVDIERTRKRKIYTQFLSDNHQGRCHLGYLDVDFRIIIKCILGKYGVNT
jgi:hypothetical protein